MNLYTHIISVDPSGAFYEGQGTTGICVYNCVDNYIQHSEHISAMKYDLCTSYWNAHIEKLRHLCKKYPKSAVVVEDYLLYGYRALDQANSRMETSQLLGVLRYWLCQHGIPHRFEQASAALPRWTNDILVFKGIIKPKGKSFQTAKGKTLNRHELDAVRHAVHSATFYNDEKGAKRWKKFY